MPFGFFAALASVAILPVFGRRYRESYKLYRRLENCALQDLVPRFPMIITLFTDPAMAIAPKLMLY